MIAWVIGLSSYVHTHTFTSERHVFESKAPEPSYSRGPEGRRRRADPRVQSSTKTSRNFFAVNEPTITFCLLIPLRFTIGLAGSPLSSPSHVPLQRSQPPVPLAIDHGPRQLPAHAGHGSLPSRFLSFMFDLCHCRRVHLKSYRLDSQLTEIFLILTTSWKPPLTMGRSSPLHTCPSFLSPVRFHSRSPTLIFLTSLSFTDTIPFYPPVFPSRASAPRLPDFRPLLNSILPCSC